jgi:zinc D-Ala-D-Ala carboxypeptidase
MRCRITGTEIPIDTRLVEILVQLHTLYGKPIELVSGHRQPLTIGTKKTSQHTLGRAADIRIPGVGIEELKRAAMKLGARGIGLYPEKGFVHVDVRQKSRYFWVYTAAGGEQQVDLSGRRVLKQVATAEQPEPAQNADSESEDGEPAAEPAHEHQPEAEPEHEQEEASQ